MKVELKVRGEKREVLEAASAFLKERKDLYSMVRGPSWVTGYTVITTEVSIRHTRFGGCLTVIVGLVGLVFEGPPEEPTLKVVAKPEGDEVTRLKITTGGGVKPEVVEPLVTWLRESFDAVT